MSLKEGDTKSEIKNIGGNTKAAPPKPGPSVPRTIPISDLKTIASKHGYSQVIAMAWHKETGTEYIATYGVTQADCEQAAIGGNLMKKTLGWPEEMCNTKPARQMNKEKMRKENDELKALLRNFIDVKNNPNASDMVNLTRFVGYTVLAEKHLNGE